VRSRPAEVVGALAGATVLLFAPLVFIGGAHYPSTGWRTGALWIVVAAGLGIAVLALVGQLRSSNQRHRLLADNASDLIARFAVDGTIIYASPASRGLLGYEPDELVGRSITANYRAFHERLGSESSVPPGTGGRSASRSSISTISSREP
jgi:PAS domain-containing protein